MKTLLTFTLLSLSAQSFASVLHCFKFVDTLHGLRQQKFEVEINDNEGGIYYETQDTNGTDQAKDSVKIFVRVVEDKVVGMSIRDERGESLSASEGKDLSRITFKNKMYDINVGCYIQR